MARHHHLTPLPAEALVARGCPLCGSPSSRRLGVDNGYAVRKCVTPNCGLVYVDPRPRPEQLAHLYTDFYDSEEAVAALWAGEMRAIVAECVDWVCADRPPGRALDVGCAFGDLLLQLEARGWSTCGVEPSPVAARRAAQRVTGEIRVGLFEAMDFEAAGFDAAIALYVLEHVFDPRDFLRRLRCVLKPGGLAIVRVPWNEPILPLNRWLGRSLMMAPAHLNDFPPRTLCRLAREVGFASAEVRVGARRRAADPVERLGAALLGGIGRGVEIATRGRWVFPWVGALSYRLRA